MNSGCNRMADPLGERVDGIWKNLISPPPPAPPARGGEQWIKGFGGQGGAFCLMGLN